MAWGVEVLNSEYSDLKREGDLKSPAGIFFLGPSFGAVHYQQKIKNMPFIPVTETLECVDDPNSVFYNRIVDASRVKKDWQNSEIMQEFGYLYNLGLVIKYNTDQPISKKGSAIFMHVWQAPATGTSGCIAMAEENLEKIVLWMDAQKRPCLVSMPFQEYRKCFAQLGLPDLLNLQNSKKQETTK